MTKPRAALRRALAARFGDVARGPGGLPDHGFLASMAARGSCRRFSDKVVEPGLIETLCAVALSAPSKSDLQLRDIVMVSDPDLRGRLDDLVAGQTWVRGAPAFLIFCGNHARQRLLHELRDRAFANDHLDAFFNAAVDAALALGVFVTAAEALGLGCCPVSAVRNKAREVSDLLALPDYVFPVAGLALGWPSETPEIAMRLPLAATLHRNRFDAESQRPSVAAYDSARAAKQPYQTQRFVEDFGQAETYTWSEDKARQYAKPERESFGAFIRAKGFKLD